MGWWEGRVGRGGGVKENLVPLYIDKMHELVVFSQVGLTIKGICNASEMQACT